MVLINLFSEFHRNCFNDYEESAKLMSQQRNNFLGIHHFFHSNSRKGYQNESSHPVVSGGVKFSFLVHFDDKSALLLKSVPKICCR